jgi:hypothetical protein
MGSKSTDLLTLCVSTQLSAWIAIHTVVLGPVAVRARWTLSHGDVGIEIGSYRVGMEVLCRYRGFMSMEVYGSSYL